MEESQEIFDLADFWLEALFHLARETEERDPILSRDLHTRRTATFLLAGVNNRLRHTLALRSWKQRTGWDRKLVLMVENIQSLCENVDDDFGLESQRSVAVGTRDHACSRLPRPSSKVWTTQTSRFSNCSGPSTWQQLDTDECRLLWQVVSGDTVSSP